MDDIFRPCPSVSFVVLLDWKENINMQIIIKGRQMQVSSQLRQRIERKVQRLSRLVSDEARVEVTVAEEQTRSARDRYAVQIALTGSGVPVHSEVSALTATSALDLVIDKVVTQLGRHKDRQTKGRRHHAVSMKVLSLARSGQLSLLDDEQELSIDLDDDASETMVGEEDNEQIWSRVMEIHRLPTEPMNDQEVIALMEESGASFYPFFNEETNSVNVMYRLNEGGYGLLIPAVEQPSRERR
jgi:putative sigma-54 modulation protein